MAEISKIYSHVNFFNGKPKKEGENNVGNKISKLEALASRMGKWGGVLRNLLSSKSHV